MIRGKIKNIFQDNQLKSIYYITPNKNESAISLPIPISEKQKLSRKLIRLDEKLRIKSFENNGARGSNIDIYKINLDSVSLINLNKEILGIPSYFGSAKMLCKKTIKEEGILLRCPSAFACAKQTLNDPRLRAGNFQIVLFHHKNKKGTKTIAFASLDSLGPSFNLKNLNVQFFENSYSLNSLIASQQNLDLFDTNVEQLIPTIQKIKSSKNILLCMVGKIFNDNSVIKGIKIFDFKVPN